MRRRWPRQATQRAGADCLPAAHGWRSASRVASSLRTLHGTSQDPLATIAERRFRRPRLRLAGLQGRRKPHVRFMSHTAARDPISFGIYASAAMGRWVGSVREAISGRVTVALDIRRYADLLLGSIWASGCHEPFGPRSAAASPRLLRQCGQGWEGGERNRESAMANFESSSTPQRG